MNQSVELKRRELNAYVRQAVALLPERQRLVVVGYFLEERSSQELARFLGVTESRVSQMRTEALEMLRAGIAAQYEANAAEASQGRQEKRRERYASAIGNAGTWQDQNLGERIRWKRRPPR